jgi:hypothetical protein
MTTFFLKNDKNDKNDKNKNDKNDKNDKCVALLLSAGVNRQMNVQDWQWTHTGSRYQMARGHHPSVHSSRNVGGMCPHRCN